MNKMNNLMNKLMNSDAKILNPSLETLEKIGYAGAALAVVSIIITVLAII